MSYPRSRLPQVRHPARIEPFSSITFPVALCRRQEALDRVSPGDTILLREGDYWEDLKTRVSGLLLVSLLGSPRPYGLGRTLVAGASI